MTNISKIIWSEEAIENLKDILHYLETNWTEKELNTFSIKLEKHLNLIQTFPYSFPLTKRRQARKAVINKQISLYYKIQVNTIEIITIFDSRQDPSKLEL